MTVSSDDARSGPYNGNASTTVFAYDFKILDQAHLVVTLTSSAGVEAVKTLTTHYTVSGVGGASGGNVTMVTAPASGEKLTITRSVPLTQLIDLQNRGGTQPSVLESAYDKLTQIVQDFNELYARVPRFPVSSAETSVELPLTLTPDTVLKVNAAGDGFENGPTTTQISDAETQATAAAASAVAAAASETAAGVSEAAAASYASPVTETFADTVGFTAGTSTTITLAATVVEDAVIITFDGVTQHHDTYSISGTTVTFTSTIPVGVLAIEASYGTRSTGAIDNIIIGANTPAAGSFTTVNGVTPATAQYTTTLNSKLNGIEALADVTDATNVTAAGALMDSELTSIASVKALNQGVATTDTPTFAGIITSGNVDGRDVSVDGTKLDGIEAAADVTDSTNVLASLVGQEVVATGFTGTLDGVLGGGTPAAVNGTTLTASGDLTFTGSNPKISGGDTDGFLALAGNTLFSGAAVQLYGSTHATTPFDIVFLNSGTPHSRYDYSATAWDFGTNALTTTGTLSAGATDVTTLTASGNAIVDNLGTGGISPVRDLHVSNAGTNVFAQWTNNTTGHTTTDGWLSGMPNGTDFRYYGYEVGGVFTFYPEETLSLTVAKLGVTVAGTLSAGATTVTTLTASGDVAINTDTLLVDVSTETIGVKMTPDVLGAPLQIKHDGTVAYLGLNGGNSDTEPFLSTWQDPDPASALFGWSFFNRSTDGNLRLSRRNNSTTDTEVLTIARSDGAATFAGTLSAGATNVTGILDVAQGNVTGSTASMLVGADANTTSRTNATNKFFTLGGAHYTNAEQPIALMSYSSTSSATALYIGSQPNGTFNVPTEIQLRTGASVTATGGTAALTLDSSQNATFAGTADITNGVYIGGSAAANLLDDYEEGTWTPVLSSATTTTYTTQIGYYTKIGNVVTVNCAFQINSLGDGSTTQLTGLPFTFFGSSSHQGAVGYFTGLATNVLSLGFYGNAGATTVNFMTTNTAGTGATLNPAIFGDGARVQFTMTYTV
jgi:hypothetical protein